MARVTKDGAIDIGQQIVDLHRRERMLAFFEFKIEGRGTNAVSGLCRISRRKKRRSGPEHLSLSFVLDTPDTAARTVATEALSALERDRLHADVDEITDVIPMPGIPLGPESYVAQTELVVAIEADESFVMSKLIPAIVKTARARLTDMEWWDVSLATQATPSTPRVTAASSLVSNVTNWLKRQVSHRS